MTLAVGTKLGPYEILSPLGAGGMGEVWKARDTRLDRLVAIKVLPEQFSRDAEFLARFEREAKAVAALSHPNILALFDIGRQEGIVYAVMELLEGESLRARLAQGPLAPRKAVDLAIQVAKGLAAAHEKGVVHRDLKPDNLWVTKDGRAKILDFGLAKQTSKSGVVANSLLATEGIEAGDAASTAKGTILGTVGYMSPEQVRGEAVDARSDLFSFGAVLYEMVTGRRAFARGSATETLAAILRDDPPQLETTTSSLPVPAGFERIIHHCLEKSADQRFRSAHDVAFALESLSTGSGHTAPFTAPFAPQNRMTTWKWGALVALLLGAAALGGWALGRRPRGEAILRTSIALPAGDKVFDLARFPLAFSPDGTTLAWVAIRDNKPQLFLRRLAEREPVPVAGTEGAASPIWSPDGQWIAFFADGALKKVAVGGAGLQTICDGVHDSRGGWWGEDGNIYFSEWTMSGIWKAPASGGKATEVTRVDKSKGEVSHRWPQLLPDRKSLLYSVWLGPGYDERQIVVESLDSKERRLLVPGGDSPRWLPSGYLLYVRQDNLFAVAWNGSKKEIGGAVPIPLPEHPRLEGEGAAVLAVSGDGKLAYLAGGDIRYRKRVVQVDRAGKVEPLPLPERDYEGIALSPDGRQAVIQIAEGTVGLWLYDFSRAVLTPFVTTGGSSQAPVWSPDGKRIAYRGTRAGARSLWWKAADGSGSEERLSAAEGVTQTPTSFSPDGRFLVYNEFGSANGNAILAMDVAGDRSSRRLVEVPPNQATQNGQVSPDGRSLAFGQVVSGLQAVFLQPFPGPGPRRQVSNGGGIEPRWSRNGRELFFLRRETLMAVDVSPGGELGTGTPRELYTGQFQLAKNANTAWEVTPDGTRFLRVQQAEPDPPLDRIELVIGWAGQLTGKGNRP